MVWLLGGGVSFVMLFGQTAIEWDGNRGRRGVKLEGFWFLATGNCPDGHRGSANPRQIPGDRGSALGVVEIS
jgi:hypothetical protein